MSNSNITRDLIRSKLLHFIKAREKAYECIVKKGLSVPDYQLKKKAIASLYVQMEASKGWDLRAHLLWIQPMRHLITTLLPFEFHDDPRQRTYRKHMLDLLNYCDEIVNTKALISKQ